MPQSSRSILMGVALVASHANAVQGQEITPIANATGIEGAFNTFGREAIQGADAASCNMSSNSLTTSSLFSSRPLVYASLGLNITLVLSLLVILALYLRNKRKQRKYPSGTRYFAVDKDRLGEYQPSLLGDDKFRTISIVNGAGGHSKRNEGIPFLPAVWRAAADWTANRGR